LSGGRSVTGSPRLVARQPGACRRAGWRVGSLGRGIVGAAVPWRSGPVVGSRCAGDFREVAVRAGKRPGTVTTASFKWPSRRRSRVVPARAAVALPSATKTTAPDYIPATGLRAPLTARRRLAAGRSCAEWQPGNGRCHGFRRLPPTARTHSTHPGVPMRLPVGVDCRVVRAGATTSINDTPVGTMGTFAGRQHQPAGDQFPRSRSRRANRSASSGLSSVPFRFVTA
jgi:hypothetical protein